MKKIAVLLLFLLLVAVAGCYTVEKSLTFKKPYREVYNKTIQFAAFNGWRIAYQDYEAKTIKIVLEDMTYSNSGSSTQYANTLSLLFDENADETIVQLKGKFDNVFHWRPEETIEEYRQFVEK